MAYAFAIRPVAYQTFADEDEQIRKCKEWGLLTDKASRMKTFYYKGNGRNETCTVVGYVDDVTAVIAFDDGTLHSIHPSYLKEMQASQFGSRPPAAASDEPAAAADEPAGGAAAKAAADEPAGGAAAKAAAEEPAGGATAKATAEESEGDATAKAAADEPDSGAAAKAAAEQADAEAAPARPAPKSSGRGSGKLKLPEDKVRMRATVKEFTTVPNHFADADDEVIVYEDVVIEEPVTELGSAWSSHSATLKKLELQPGDTLTFEAKVAAKKLTRHPVPYKINNPSKIQKQ